MYDSKGVFHEKARPAFLSYIKSAKNYDSHFKVFAVFSSDFVDYLKIQLNLKSSSNTYAQHVVL